MLSTGGRLESAFQNGGGIFTIWKCDPDEQAGSTFLTYIGEAVNAHVYVCVQKKLASCVVPWTPVLFFFFQMVHYM